MKVSVISGIFATLCLKIVSSKLHKSQDYDNRNYQDNYHNNNEDKLLIRSDSESDYDDPFSAFQNYLRDFINDEIDLSSKCQNEVKGFRDCAKKINEEFPNLTELIMDGGLEKFCNPDDTGKDLAQCKSKVKEILDTSCDIFEIKECKDFMADDAISKIVKNKNCSSNNDEISMTYILAGVKVFSLAVCGKDKSGNYCPISNFALNDGADMVFSEYQKYIDNVNELEDFSLSETEDLEKISIVSNFIPKEIISVIAKTCRDEKCNKKFLAIDKIVNSFKDNKVYLWGMEDIPYVFAGLSFFDTLMIPFRNGKCELLEKINSSNVPEITGLYLLAQYGLDYFTSDKMEVDKKCSDSIKSLRSCASAISEDLKLVYYDLLSNGAGEVCNPFDSKKNLDECKKRLPGFIDSLCGILSNEKCSDFINSDTIDNIIYDKKCDDSEDDNITTILYVTYFTKMGYLGLCTKATDGNFCPITKFLLNEGVSIGFNYETIYEEYENKIDHLKIESIEEIDKIKSLLPENYEVLIGNTCRDRKCNAGIQALDKMVSRNREFQKSTDDSIFDRYPNVTAFYDSLVLPFKNFSCSKIDNGLDGPFDNSSFKREQYSKMEILFTFALILLSSLLMI